MTANPPPYLLTNTTLYGLSGILTPIYLVDAPGFNSFFPGAKEIDMTEFILLILKVLGCVALWLLIVGIIYVVLIQTLTLLLKILNNIR
jgi:hypothetical protein